MNNSNYTDYNDELKKIIGDLYKVLDEEHMDKNVEEVHTRSLISIATQLKSVHTRSLVIDTTVMGLDESLFGSREKTGLIREIEETIKGLNKTMDTLSKLGWGILSSAIVYIIIQVLGVI